MAAVVGLIGGLFVTNAVYTFGTFNEKIITVDSKFISTNSSGGSKDIPSSVFSEYNVSDKTNAVYRVQRSWLYMHFSNVELWNSLKEQESYKIGYFGWRIPFLGVFPNIVKAEKDILKPVQ